MYTLPTTVVAGDKTYTITNDGDYRMVLDCFKALNDDELSENLRVLASLLIFYNEFNSIEDVNIDEEILVTLVKEMFSFMSCGSDNQSNTNGQVLIDWDDDSQMICAAINNVAHAEIRAIPYIHWWTFMGYYMSIGESVMATVISIRDKIVKQKKLEDWEKEFKKDNPQYFNWKRTSVEAREAERAIRELWKKGGTT